MVMVMLMMMARIVGEDGGGCGDGWDGACDGDDDGDNGGEDEECGAYGTGRGGAGRGDVILDGTVHGTVPDDKRGRYGTVRDGVGRGGTGRQCARYGMSCVQSWFFQLSNCSS